VRDPCPGERAGVLLRPYDASTVDDVQRDLADRLALRRLVDTYARDVDRRDTDAVADLFGPAGRLVAHFDPGAPGSPNVRTGRDAIRGALVDGLARYLGTTHVVGGQVVDLGVDGDIDRATGETTCLAHHVYDAHGERRLLVMAVRYHDDYERAAAATPMGWWFAQRELHFDWRDDRPLAQR
jgi:hypothetical protein